MLNNSKDLVGKTISAVEVLPDKRNEVVLSCTDGSKYYFQIYVEGNANADMVIKEMK
jgi:uncharacterized cupredoxin-like copper-binding protein